MRNFSHLSIFVLLLLGACTSGNEEAQGQAIAVVNQTAAKIDKLSDYWYQGKAEVNTYQLQQNRYNALHPGEVVAIFVTEDFLTDKQVKNDNYTNPNSTPILKSNLLWRFTTGLYDYSVMSSTFTDVSAAQSPQTLKVTTSAQDWCGHAWMQLNQRKGSYDMQLHSYFEGEADQNVKGKKGMLEDEILNRIRINPEALPTGSLKMFPANHVLRLRHLPFASIDVQAQMTSYQGEDFEGDNLMVYRLEMPSINRQVEYVFQAEAPYRIEGWKDTYPSAFDKKPRATIAKRQKTIVEPYWRMNKKDDFKNRKPLDLLLSY